MNQFIDKVGKTSVSIWVLVLSNLLVFQLSGFFYSTDEVYDSTAFSKDVEYASLPTSSTASESALAIPRGKAVALPSVRINDNGAGYERKNYGGQGDKPHLGGFATNSVDMDGVSPAVWKYMVEEVGVKSILDVGCGRGVSTSWFYLHGVETLCVEGSHDAVEQSLLPAEIVTEHDFSRGPWWPPRTVDAIWCVELLEHVGRNFHRNLIPTFRKAAVIYASHSTWGGWHHVEVHMSDWWIQKFESYGFRYSEELTQIAKQKASGDKGKPAPNGMTYSAQHIWLHIMVFINPEVAALPEHHHLFAEGGHGCFKDFATGLGGGRRIVHRPCGVGTKDAETTESRLPGAYLPIQLDATMDEKWEKLVFGDSQPE